MEALFDPIISSYKINFFHDLQNRQLNKGKGTTWENLNIKYKDQVEVNISRLPRNSLNSLMYVYKVLIIEAQLQYVLKGSLMYVYYNEFVLLKIKWWSNDQQVSSKQHKSSHAHRNAIKLQW